jgi:hypothetical protein
MKNYILSILMFIYVYPVLSQENFPDSNAIWNVNIIGSNEIPTGEVLYGLKGDTIINDTLYRKLYLLKDTTLETKSLNYYLGGFRLENQMIFFKPKYWNFSDILLYDFSVSIGDTVWHNAYLKLFDNIEYTHEFEKSKKYNVIQDITNESGKTKYILLDINPQRDEWYLGFGSIIGLFGSIIDYPLIGDTYNLACFKQNDTVKYNNNLKCNKCFCRGSTGIDGKEKDLDWLVLSPNSIQNSLSIKINKPYSQISVKIIDEKGSLLYSNELLENYININNNLKGTYFIKLTIDNEEIIKKIVFY